MDVLRRLAFVAALAPLYAFAVISVMLALVVAGGTWLLYGGERADDVLMRWTDPAYRLLEAVAAWAGIEL